MDEPVLMSNVTAHMVDACCGAVFFSRIDCKWNYRNKQLTQHPDYKKYFEMYSRGGSDGAALKFYYELAKPVLLSHLTELESTWRWSNFKGMAYLILANWQETWLREAIEASGYKRCDPIYNPNSRNQIAMYIKDINNVPKPDEVKGKTFG